jgi:hypothetical protein
MKKNQAAVCKRMHWLAFLYGSSVLFCIMGCGGSVATVSGKVSYQGKPLSGGTVTLIPEQGVPLTGAIKPDGSYSIAKVPFGRVKVAVETKSAQSKQPSGVIQLPAPIRQKTAQLPKELENPNNTQETSRYIPIPDRYSDPDKSGLSFVVEKSKQVFDLELK